MDIAELREISLNNVRGQVQTPPAETMFEPLLADLFPFGVFDILDWYFVHLAI